MRTPSIGVPLDAMRGPREARGAGLSGVRVHSVRLPGYVIAVEAIFGSAGQRLHLKHEASSSAEPYVDGALLAIRKVGGLLGVHRGLDAVMDGLTVQPTERFSDRAAVYTRGRPTYPDAIVAHLRAAGALPEHGVVVDIGVGTGLSSEPFLRAGYAVIGVEPNAPMRAVGDERLAHYGRYRSVDGSAEETTLPPR